MRKKRIKYIKIIVIFVIFVLVIGFLSWGNKSKGVKVKESSSEAASEKVVLGQKEKSPSENEVLEQKEEEPVEQESETENANITDQYITISQKGNIDIIVNYLNPVIGSNDVLTFEVSLGTHSIDLTEYKDIRKFVELRTDIGEVVTEGFEWDVENAESHHINGSLKIKNNIEGKPIVGQDTKSFKLIFKDIPDEGEREHLYEGEKLK